VGSVNWIHLALRALWRRLFSPVIRPRLGADNRCSIIDVVREACRWHGWNWGTNHIRLSIRMYGVGHNLKALSNGWFPINDEHARIACDERVGGSKRFYILFGGTVFRVQPSRGGE
jgi:hypothetical protein